jgi:hypothetical protein
MPTKRLTLKGLTVLSVGEDVKQIELQYFAGK